MPILQAINVSKRFNDVTAISDISLDVLQGEIVCLLGPNGAGKTTLINVFLGFVKPDSGTVSVVGANPSEHPAEARKKVAYVPESVALYPDLTAMQNIQFFSSFSERSPGSQDLGQCLLDAGLPEQDHGRKTSQFSKGMRQKVGLAIALSKQAEVTLLDEPLTGLDPESATELILHLEKLKNGGTTILLATHDIFHVCSISTRVGMLRDGQLVDLLDAESLSAYELEKLYLSRMRENS